MSVAMSWQGVEHPSCCPVPSLLPLRLLPVGAQFLAHAYPWFSKLLLWKSLQLQPHWQAAGQLRRRLRAHDGRHRAYHRC